MPVEKSIDDLIEAARQVIDSDFDATAFNRWKLEAFKCTNALVGPEHTHTRYFKSHAQLAEARSRAAEMPTGEAVTQDGAGETPSPQRSADGYQSPSTSATPA